MVMVMMADEKKTDTTLQPDGEAPGGAGDKQRVEADGPEAVSESADDDAPTIEVNGRKKGLDPTRYGDWEKNGRAIDF
jgi:hypothetical protein